MQHHYQKKTPLESENISIKTMSLFSILPERYQYFSFSDLSSFSQGIDYALFLIVSTQKAIDSFLKKELSNFDALIGENSCQIRALLFSSPEWNNNIFINNLISIRAQLELCHSRINGFKSDSAQLYFNTTLEKFILSNSIDVQICEKTIFLIMCFILTVSKEVTARNDISKPGKLKHLYANIPKKAASAIVENCQKKASAYSIKFLLSHIKRHIDSDYIFGNDILANHIKYDSSNRSALPCLLTSHAMLSSISIRKTLLAFKVHLFSEKNEYRDTLHLIFRGIGKIGNPLIFPSFKLIDQAEIDSSENLVVIEGNSLSHLSADLHQNFVLSEMNSLGASQIVLANGLFHPQYPESCEGAIDDLLSLPAVQYFSQELANIKGCSIENSSLFCIFHIYANNPSAELASKKHYILQYMAQTNSALAIGNAVAV